jgi:putative endonuclease
MPFYAYVLRSLANGHLYKGSTENIEKRISEHNAGTVTYTSRYLPWELVYFEKFDSRTEAIAREKFLKSGQGRAWLKTKLLSIKNEGMGSTE